MTIEYLGSKSLSGLGLPGVLSYPPYLHLEWCCAKIGAQTRLQNLMQSTATRNSESAAYPKEAPGIWGCERTSVVAFKVTDAYMGILHGTSLPLCRSSSPVHLWHRQRVSAACIQGLLHSHEP